MIGALRALLGPEPYGFDVENGGQKVPRHIDDRFPRPALDLADKPTAILLGPRTASSGEAVAVSLIGRPGTRTFGEPTAGLSSSNTIIPLLDGGQLVLTVGLQADRTGRVYGQKLLPDEPTSFTAGPKAAAEWLRSQSNCH